MTSPQTPAVLELRGVTKTYRVKQGLFGTSRPLTAVNDVSLSLPRGEVLGLVGESGCGKSTLAKILLGLEAPTSGQVLVDGEEIRAQDRMTLARRIQPIFQDPYSSLNPRKSIFDIVSLPLRVHGIGDRNHWDAEVRKILDIVGLPARVMNTFPSQMSGGQRQRVAIARALIMKPEIVICDEPTSALDVSVQSQVLNLMSDLREELGLTYLFISHDLTVVQHMADVIGVLYLGRLVEEAPRDRLFNEPKHPYTQMLFDAAPRMDAFGREIDPPKGEIPDAINPPPGCAFHPRCPLATDRCRTENPEMRNIGTTRVACHHAQ
mgnify:CR=1 FL=1